MAFFSPIPHAFCLPLGFTAHAFFQAAIASLCTRGQGWANRGLFCHTNAVPCSVSLLQRPTLSLSCPTEGLPSPTEGGSHPSTPCRSVQTFLHPHCCLLPHSFEHLQLLFTQNLQHHQQKRLLQYPPPLPQLFVLTLQLKITKIPLFGRSGRISRERVSPPEPPRRKLGPGACAQCYLQPSPPLPRPRGVLPPAPAASA